MTELWSPTRSRLLRTRCWSPARSRSLIRGLALLHHIELPEIAIRLAIRIVEILFIRFDLGQLQIILCDNDLHKLFVVLRLAAFLGFEAAHSLDPSQVVGHI